MPSLEELLAANAAPDDPVPAAPPPAVGDASLPIDQLLALNAAPDEVGPAPASTPEVQAPPAPPRPTTNGVRVIAPDGRTGYLPPEEVDRAVRLDGYKLLTPEMEAAAAQEAALQSQYGDGGGQAIAAVEGLGRGASLGISDYLGKVGAGVASALGPDVPRATGAGLDAGVEDRGWYDERAADAAAKDIAGYRAANPITAGLSEAGGAITTALASGGTGTAGTLARLTPAGRLAQLGTALGERLTAKLGTTALGKIGALGLAAAAEGATDNAIRQVTEDLTAGDVDITAERMLDAAWEGAKWGGLLGTGLAAVGEGLGRLARGKAAQEVVQAADEVAPSQVDEAAQAARPRADIEADLEAAQQKLAEADAIGEQSAIEEAENAVEALSNERDAAVTRDYGMRSERDIEMALEVREPQEAQGLWQSFKSKFRQVKDAKELDQRFQDTIDSATKDITDKLDDLQRGKQNEIDPRISRNNKPKAIKAALEKEGVQWTYAQAERVLAENEEALRAMDELRADYALGDEVARRKLGPLKSAREAIEGVQKHLTDLKNTAGKVDFRDVGINPGATILRGDTDAIARIFWAEDNLKSYLGQIAKKKGETVTQAEAAIQRIYMRKRSALQDPKLYGKALAEMQTVTNAIESRAIPAGRIFHAQFGRAKILQGEHAGEQGFEELMEMDPGRIRAFLKNLAEADSYKDESDFIRGLQRTVELAEAKANYYPVSDAVRARIAKSRQVVDSVIGDVKAIKVLKQQRDQALRLAKEHEGIDKVMMALDAAGAFLPGVHIVGKTLGAMGSAVKLATSVENLGAGAVKSEQAVERAVSRTVKSYFRGPTERVREAFKKGTIPGTGITGNQLRRAVEDAEALQDPESEQSKNLGAQLMDLSRESPELAAALEDKVRSKAAFILSKRGPVLDRSDPFRTTVARQDPVSEARTARYIEAVNNPGKALDRLATGTGTAEDVETLRALYPKQYARYVMRVQDRVAQAKVPPTTQQRARLQWSTGVPFSREQQPEYVAYLQGLQTKQPEEEPEESDNLKPMVSRAKAAPLDFESDQVMARSDAIMSGGAA